MSDIELSDGKGIVAPQWAANEELMSEDINIVSEITYKNYLNLSALLTRVAQTTADQVFSGLQTTVTGSLTASVSMGMGVSFSGSYFTASGNWGFVANTGTEGFSFVVTNPIAQSVTFSANTNATDNRIDIIEIAPTRLNDSNATRNFLDSVTDAITPASTPTRYNFSASVIIKQGTPAASPVAPTTDPGYIKLAEVTVPANSGAITQSDVVQFGDSGAWTTNASTTAQYNVVLWNSEVYYHPGEPVFSGGQIYFCLLGNRGNNPSGAPTYWQVFNLATGSPYLNVRQQYISNPGFDSDTSGWNLYTDGGATPTSGSGTFTGTLTFSRNTTSPLFGAGDAILNNNAASQQGSGVAYDFSIDPGNVGQVMMLQFFVESTGAYASGDVGVYIYDKTNAILIPTSLVNVSQGGSPTQWFATWIPTTSTSYRLILHVQTTNASEWTLEVDNFNVGPYEQVTGAAIGPWESFPLNITADTTNGSLGTASSSVCVYRRVGSNMEVYINWAGSTGGSPGSGVYRINLPLGYTIDTSKLRTAVVNYVAVVGTAVINGGNPIAMTMSTVVNLEDTDPVSWVRVLGSTYDGSSPNYLYGAMTFYGSNYIGLENTINISLKFSVPIAQWSDNINLATDFQEFAWNSSTSTGDDTTSFGNGSGGVLFTAMAPSGTAFVTKRIRFQNPIGATDRLIFEVDSGVGEWEAIADRLASYNANDAGTEYYGIQCLPVSGTNTDVNVYFYSRPQQWPDTTLWSTLTTWYWRVRKISNGNSAEQPPVVDAEYTTTSGTYSGGSSYVINYATKQRDTNNNVTTGSGWQFLCTVPGTYLIGANLNWSTGSSMQMFLNKNGSAISQYGNGTFAWSGASVFVSVVLAVGDVIDVTLTPQDTNSISLSGLSVISITRVGT